MAAVLLRPKLLAERRRWLSPQGFLRWPRLFALIAAIAAAALSYQGVRLLLVAAQSSPFAAQLTPTALLASFFASLGCLLLLINLGAALHVFFTAEDLALLVPAPLTAARFFSSRLLETCLSTSWLPVVVVLPALLAFGRQTEAGSLYFFALPLAVLPMLLLPAAIAVAVDTLLLAAFPLNRIRQLLYLLALGSLISVFLATPRAAPPGVMLPGPTPQQLSALLALPMQEWLPSYHAGAVLAGLVEGAVSAELWRHLALLYGMTLCVGLIVQRLTQRVYLRAYSSARCGIPRTRRHGRTAQKGILRYLPAVPPPFRAIFAKELKTFARDLTQPVHLLLLIGAGLFYLSSLAFLHRTWPLDNQPRLWWEALLVLMNLTMGIFMVTALSGRFAFASVAREGAAYWLISSAPLPALRFLYAKFAAWLIPIAAIATVIALAGALALDAAPAVVLVSGLLCMLFCYGIVGAAIGLGACFWSPDSEGIFGSSIGLGTIAYLMTAAILGTLNLLPVILLLFLHTMHLFGMALSTLQWAAALLGSFVLLTYLDTAAAHWAMKAGAAALRGEITSG